MERWPQTAVVGPGAVGCFFGGMLARAGAPVTLFGRPDSQSPHLRALREHGLVFDGVQIQETIPLPIAEIGPSLADAELVLFCVKSMDTTAAARAIEPHLRSESVVVSLQNGIDNVDRMRNEGVEALPTVVFVAAAVEVPGAIKHRGRGDLIIGDPENRADRLAAAQRVSDWFEEAGVPCPVSKDIRRDQWIKLTLNSMTNGISALTGASYRRLADFEPTWETSLAIAAEAIAVAAAEGTELDLNEIVAQGMGIVNNIGEATSSTQQDIAAGRRTEIDALNGSIAQRGARLGVPTPINETIYALVKLREEYPA
jgi:2-dehydropantoate 2-reductase